MADSVGQHEDRSADDGTAMDNQYPAEAWKRLGKALERRRGQLGYGYRQRGRFVRERSGRVSEKTIARLERGDRPAYPDSTLALVEVLYGWRPGSVIRVLDGGDPVPADAPEPEAKPAIDRLDRRERELIERMAELLVRNREEAVRPRPAGSGAGSLPGLGGGEMADR